MRKFLERRESNLESTIFWQNLEEARNLAEKDFNKRELYYGKKLLPEVQLVNEYLKLSSVFTFVVGEEYDFEKYNAFRVMLKDLHEAIDSLYSNLINIDVKTIQKIIVHLDLELGTDITYYAIFLEMLENNELDEDYNEMGLNFTFDYLSRKYSDNSKKRSR